MTDRKTLDQMTSNDLDQLYDERDTLRQQLDAAHRRYDSLDAAQYALGPLIDRPFRSHRQPPTPAALGQPKEQ